MAKRITVFLQYCALHCIDIFSDGRGASKFYSGNLIKVFVFVFATLIYSQLSFASSFTIENYKCLNEYKNNNSSVLCPLVLTTSVTTNYNGEDISCYGASDGAAQVTVAGALGPLTYLWSNFTVGPNIIGVPAGIYTVTVTQTIPVFCVASATVQITEPDTITITETHVDVCIPGNNSGSIDITVSGGTGPYTFLWTNTATTEDISSLTAGPYGVQVTDANGCTKTKIIPVLEPVFELVVDVWDAIDLTCFGANDGSIDMRILDGVPPYSYIWSSGHTTEDITGLSPGTYTLTVTDTLGCTKSNSATIASPPELISSESHTDVSCFGANDGTINITASGGTPPIRFNWQHIGGPNNPQNLTGLAPGSYRVRVYDFNGCDDTLSITITEPLVLSISETHVDISCFGASDGSIDVSPSGGTLPYSFNWSTGATAEDVSALDAGSYTLTITDANSCKTSVSATINEPDSLDISESHINISCNGADDGSIDLKVSGGRSPYSFNWSNGETTEDISSLSPNTYSVTVTDVNSCTGTLSVTITEPLSLAISEVIVDVLCTGDSTGSIDVTVTGGTTPYSYNWSHLPALSDPEDPSNLWAATYTVTVTDANGCTIDDDYDVDEPGNALSVFLDNVVDVECNGESTGEIIVNVNGGTGGRTYLWSDGSTSEDLNNAPAGTYTVTATDANGCTASYSDTINEPSAIVFTETHVDILCNGFNTGSIDLTTSGGVAPYTWDWAHIGGASNPDDITNQFAGTYTVFLEDDNECKDTLEITLTEPPLIAITETHNDVTCNGDADGNIDISVVGGVPPYSYSWSSGQTTEDISSLSGDTFTVTVTDANLCTMTLAIEVMEPGVVTITEIENDISCFGLNDGSIDVTTTGGRMPLTFNWSSGETTEDLSGLGAGTYTLTATDVNGCDTTATYIITEPPLLTISETHTDVLCFGASTGSIDITPGGGVGSYSFNWSNGETTEDISGLAAGTYTVTVTDGNLCNDTISVTITEGNDINIAYAHVDVKCFGGTTGSIDLTITGGTPGYIFDWLHIPGPSNPADINFGLAANTYTVVVTDANGCTNSNSITINEPTQLVVSESHVNISCFSGNDGSINLSVVGGTPAYSYAWNNGATTEDISSLIAGIYTVTVTDDTLCTSTLSVTLTEPALLSVSETHVNVSCNGGSDGAIDITPAGGIVPYTFGWSSGQTTEDIAGLATGTYTVTVTDSLLCVDTLEIIITQPSSLTVSETHVDAKCNSEASGSINITPSGGTAPYTYNWTNGATTEDVSSLLSGSYTVTVTDNEGCTITISAAISEPTAITLIETHEDVSCNGGSDGSIDITSAGGTGSHNYFWSTLSAAEDISGLTAGTYTVTVTDSNFCTASFSIAVGEPTPLTIVMSKTNTSCTSNFDGTATATPGGATPPYTYLWSTGATTQTIAGLDSNTYTVTVTDSLGCFETDTISVPFIQLLNATANVTSDYNGYDVSCVGSSDGFGNVLAAGGTPLFNYLWSNGQTTSLLQNVTAGGYTVTVTDSRACTAVDSIELSDPPALSMSLSVASDFNGQNISCNGNSDGAINSAISGGASPYTYLWSNSATTDSLTGLTAGSYTLTATDANGCSVSRDTTLTEPDTIILSLSPLLYGAYNISCAGGNDGSISAAVTDGTPPYSYMWSNGATNAANSNLTAGYYELTVTDANGCTTANNIILNEPPAMGFTYASSNPSDCGVNDAIISVAPSGGIGLYEYSLDGITYQTQNFWNSLATGSYNVYVRSDTGNCVSGPQLVVIGSAEVPVIDNHVIIHPTTGASNDGGILLQVSGNGLALEYSIDGVNWQTSNVFSGLGTGPYTVTVRYVTQNCISTLNVTLIAGNGVEGSITNSQVCSDGQSATQFVSLFYVPMPEDDILTAFLNIYNPSCGASSFPGSPLFGYNSIGVVEGGTVINYDHWEDGYEPNLQFPVLATTEIWGDNDPTNGIAPGYAVDFFNAGDIIILSDTVDPLTLGAVIDFDAGDKFGSQGDLYYSRMIWPSNTNSFLAGAAEVYPVAKWGTTFTIPVGENTANQSSMFEYTGLMVMASEPNTIISINGVPTDTLNEGENFYLDGGVNEGTVVTATLPVQVQLLTGDRCSRFESRFYSLTPTNTWANNYYNPVSTRGGRTASTYIFNPGSSAISVTREVPGGGTTNINVPAGASNFDDTPNSVGTRYFTAGGEPFYAVVTMDKGGTGVDWGYALLPAQDLSGQITLVGFAPGENPVVPSGTTNASPIWITADYPDGSIYDGNPINIYVDYDGDGGALTDPFGTMYDASFTINSLDQLILYDPDENDQTGMKIWIGDTTDAILAGAYGQEPGASGSQAAMLDLGTGLFNKVPFLTRKCVDLYTDYTNNGLFDECDEVIYTLIMANTGSLPLIANSINIRDTLSSQLTYIPNTTQLITQSGIIPIPDNGGANTTFPLDETGYFLSDLIQPGDSIRINFQATINKSLGAGFVSNKAYIANSNTELTPEVSFPVQNPANVSMPGILNDTTINCDQVVPEPPYRDTCLSNIYLNSNNFALYSVTSEDTSGVTGDAIHAFDNDPNTYWSSNFTPGPPAGYPHVIQIDLGSVQTSVRGLAYLPRQDTTLTRIGDYEIYLSIDGIAWGSPVNTGTWNSTATVKQVSFSDTTARYVRLRAISAADGGVRAGAAEIDVLICDQQVVYNDSTTRTANGSCTDIAYTIIREWTVTNHCGNVATQNRVITVQDTTAPQIFTIPADVSVHSDSVPAIPSLLAMDNCDTNVVLTQIDSVYASGCDTIIKRIWTATDICGNVFSDFQLITVLTCPESCSNGIDDDGDGLIDCDDPDCYLGLDVDVGNDTLICRGDNFTLNAVTSGGTGPFTYTWDNGLGAGQSHVVAPLVNTTYTATVTDVNGCTNTASIEITINSMQITNLFFNDLVGSDDTIINNGFTYNTSNLPAFFNIQANKTGPGIGSVKYTVTGPVSGVKIDNSFPFRYPTNFGPFGDSSGTYTVVAEVFADKNAQGPICQTFTVSFTFNDIEICNDGIDNDGDGDIDCADSQCEPTTPGAISYSDTVECAGNNAVYSIAAVPGAISYDWVVPPGATIIAGQGTTNISVNWGSTGGNICVRSYNGFCYSSNSCQNITIQSPPATPGSIIH